MKINRLATCLLLAASLLAPTRPLRAGQSDGRLDVYFNDVEGGAATLLVTPAGESVLIDTGNAGDRDPGRIFASAKLAGLTKIDFLIITHFHGDHFGGAANLSKLIPIGTLYDNGDESPTADRPTPAYLAIKPEKKITMQPGNLIPLKDGPGPRLTILCLAAHKKFLDAHPSAKPNPFAGEATEKPLDTSDNANSIVNLISFGDFRFYDGGDLTWNMEKQLVTPLNRVGTVDVYQVTHHGLDQSNNPVLVKAIEPTVAIMNNGSTKGCEPVEFATLKSTPSIQAIWQLHKNLRPDGNINNTAPEYIANADKDCKGEIVKMSVAADAKTYTVSIPSTGFTKTYETKKHE